MRRDRVSIVKDIILKLGEYGELSQTALISYCGINKRKHKFIIDDLESKELIIRNEVFTGKRTITIYRLAQKGLEFYRTILEPYEEMFPRRRDIINAAKGRKIIISKKKGDYHNNSIIS
jgi:predicted transcriptional regulator